MLINFGGLVFHIYFPFKYIVHNFGIVLIKTIIHLIYVNNNG